MDAVESVREMLKRESRRGLPREYADAERGTRAKSRMERDPRRCRRVWIAGDFRAGEFRTRREALRHCPPGTGPLLVEVPSRAYQRVNT